MAALTRATIFAQAAQKLRQDFAELSTIPHNALRGGEAEKLMRSFLNGHLPKRFAAGAGFIIDPKDVVSRQTDVVVYDAFNCPVYRASDDAGIFPSNNVAAVVEVKSSLDKAELIDGLDKIAAVKKLARVRTPEIGMPVMDAAFGCVFGFESAITLDKLTEHLHEWLRVNAFPLHADLIVVLDRGLITLVANMPGVPGWNPLIAEGLGGQAGEGVHLGLGVLQTEEGTLDAFLRFLLAHLSLFRGMMDHPGFGIGDYLPKGQMKVSYLTSITTEKDPVKRQAKLDEYRKLVIEDFKERPVPENWPREKPNI
jgi:hypothetical protein